MYQCYVFGPPGSASGSISHRYESEDPDPHPDPYQNVTVSQISNTGRNKCVLSYGVFVLGISNWTMCCWIMRVTSSLLTTVC
jgi:hypothetical protein